MIDDKCDKINWNKRVFYDVKHRNYHKSFVSLTPPSLCLILHFSFSVLGHGQMNSGWTLGKKSKVHGIALWMLNAVCDTWASASDVQLYSKEEKCECNHQDYRVISPLKPNSPRRMTTNSIKRGMKKKIFCFRSGIGEREEERNKMRFWGFTEGNYSQGFVWMAACDWVENLIHLKIEMFLNKTSLQPVLQNCIQINCLQNSWIYNLISI